MLEDFSSTLFSQIKIIKTIVYKINHNKKIKTFLPLFLSQIKTIKTIKMIVYKINNNKKIKAENE